MERTLQAPWLDGAPPVFLVGVNYDPAKRGIDDPLVERTVILDTSPCSK